MPDFKVIDTESLERAMRIEEGEFLYRAGQAAKKFGERTTVGAALTPSELSEYSRIFARAVQIATAYYVETHVQ